jgi:hypothetical protein
MSFRTLIATLFLVLAMANAFVPASRPAFGVKRVSQSSALAFGFLKDLGLEKPSWLPDFGSAKKEEEAAPAAETESKEEAPAPVEE